MAVEDAFSFKSLIVKELGIRIEPADEGIRPSPAPLDAFDVDAADNGLDALQPAVQGNIRMS